MSRRPPSPPPFRRLLPLLLLLLLTSSYAFLLSTLPSSSLPGHQHLEHRRSWRLAGTTTITSSSSSTEQQSTPATPPSFSADEREAVFAFERRLNDASVAAEGLEHALFWPAQDFAPSRGLRTTKGTTAGSMVIELPRGQSICLDEGENTPFPQWVPQKQWKKMPWYAQLGLKLVYERKMSTSPFKASYAELLPPPKGLPTPFHWSETDLEVLHAAYPSLANKVDRQRQVWAGLYDTLGKTRAVREDMDEETFVWAMESVLSRAFKGTFGTGFRSLAPSLFLMALFSAIYYIDQESIQLVSYVLDESPLLMAVPATLTLLPLFLEFLRSKGTYVLAPMIDSLNHRSTVATDLDYDSIRQRFRLSLGEGFAKDEQVFMSYGQKSNDDLVLHYGFVESDSKADVFEFADLLGWLTSRKTNVVNDDRVQTLFSKGLQDAVKACKLGRGGRIVDEKALEGLRILLASDDELRAENAITESIIQTPMFLTMDEFQDSVFSKELQSPTELAVYEALLQACEEAKSMVVLTASEEEEMKKAQGNRGAGGVKENKEKAPRLLTLAFRREKVRVLEEAIMRFRRLTGQGGGGKAAAEGPKVEQP